MKKLIIFIAIISVLRFAYSIEQKSKSKNSKVFFNSRDLKYKTPFGAQIQGSEIKFTIETKVNSFDRVRLVVEREKIVGNQERYIYDEKIKYPMKKTGYSKNGNKEFWNVSVKFNNINVYGYYFELVKNSKITIYANNKQKLHVPWTKVIGTQGVGELYKSVDKEIIRYKQTIYDKDFKTPDWAKDVIYYYIFPERFKNGNRSNDPKVGKTKFYGKKNIEVHKNWNDKKPWTPGDHDGNKKDDKEWCNDFYGGDLKGILIKLDYLKSLGINTIYLNPIFEAPSNHKYDTADYKKVDDNFGTNREFEKLVNEAKKREIRIILDVSLNHSGSDSKYMDRYGKYPGVGAFENEKIRKNSKYYDWYEFNEKEKNPDKMYNQWANPTLANLKETDSYKNFAFRDRDSVIKFWLDKGIAGWRMDVAPWVSDTFWREWRRELKEKNSDALTIAETWFDSSKYFLGDMFDSTMNYIFRQAIYDYANGEDAKRVVNALEMIRENYPKEAFYSLMNLLSTHDSARALHHFGYKEEGESENDIKIAKERLLLSLFFQMTYPGAPAIFYGDEVGMTGGDDPFNRGPFPWKEDGGEPDNLLLSEFKKLIKLRNKNIILRRGNIKTIHVDENIIVMIRKYKDQIAIVATNNSSSKKIVNIDLSKHMKCLPKSLNDMINLKHKIKIENGKLVFSISRYSGRVLIN